MAKEKNSFVLYCDLVHTFRKLSDEQAGKLFKHILEYVNDTNPELDDALLDIVFEPIKQALKRDLAKYERTCKRNSENGSKGGRPKKPTKTEKTHSVISKPKKADSDSDIDSDSVNDNESEVSVYTHPLSIWVNSLPQLNKLKYPLTDDESERLISEYDKSALKEVFESMSNKNGLTKSYQSANLTVRSWINLRRKTDPNYAMIKTGEDRLSQLKKERGWE